MARGFTASMVLRIQEPFVNIIANLACMCCFMFRSRAYLPHSYSREKKKRKHRVIDCCNPAFFFVVLPVHSLAPHCFFFLFISLLLFHSFIVRCVDGVYTIIITSIWVHDKNDESLFYDWRQLCTILNGAQWIVTQCICANEDTARAKKNDTLNRQHVTVCENVWLLASTCRLLVCQQYHRKFVQVYFFSFLFFHF